MTKKCMGCGAVLQDNNVLLDGYTNNLTNNYCTRCFRMKNYGDYQTVVKSNEDFIEILKSIGNTKSLVLYVVDVLNVPENIDNIKQYLEKNDVILVLNKRDVLPLSIIDDKLINYFKEHYPNFLDVILISALKDYNLDLLYSKINKYRKTKNVYVVGYTNAGKSMLINKFMKNYMAQDEVLSISAMPSTTLGKIELDFGDFKIIDTPGIIDNKSIVNYVSPNMLKIISPKKEIKPKVFQIRKNQAIIIGDLFRIDYVSGEKNSVVVFVSNDLKVKRLSSRNTYLKNLDKRDINVLYKEDLVINGLGFIKISDECSVSIYLNKDVSVFKRKNMI